MIKNKETRIVYEMTYEELSKLLKGNIKGEIISTRTFMPNHPLDKHYMQSCLEIITEVKEEI